MNKFSRKPDDSCDGGDQSEESSRNNFKQGFCSVFSYVSTFTRDLFVGPPTDLQDCLNAFFDACELKGDNKYFCTHCKRSVQWAFCVSQTNNKTICALNNMIRKLGILVIRIPISCHCTCTYIKANCCVNTVYRSFPFQFPEQPEADEYYQAA